MKNSPSDIGSVGHNIITGRVEPAKEVSIMGKPYTIDKEALTLRLEGALAGQDIIDLSVLNDSAEVLAVISLYARKTFMSAEMLGNLVMGLQEALLLEANYCPGGRDAAVKAPQDVKAILEKTVG